MSDNLNPSDTLRQAHDLPKGKHIAGHRITVEGIYHAFDAKGEKVKRQYSEVFDLAPHEHRVHGQGALGHILSDKMLSERLSKKDPEFRAIQTHIVTKHENIFVDAPAPDDESEDNQQEA